MRRCTASSAPSHCQPAAASSPARMIVDEKEQQHSWINFLPDELILTIFHHLRKHHDWTNLAMLQSSVTVSQVCSRWRAIALEASLLWSEIVFRIPPMRDRRLTERAHTRMETCLQRSRNHPLNIHMDLFSYDRDSTHDIMDKFVFPNLWRCHIVEVTVSNGHPAYAIFPLLGDLSSIQSLGVVLQSDFGQEDDKESWNILVSDLAPTGFAPKRLRLDATVPVFFPDIDTSNLEDLYIADYDIGYESMLHFLNACTHVRRLHLVSIRFDPPGRLFNEPIFFPDLYFLSTIFDWPSPNFHAPSLKKLFVFELLFVDSLAWLEVSQGLPQLRHLTLVGVIEEFDVLDVGKIFAVLGHFPQLVTLELKRWPTCWLLHFAVASPMAPVAVDTEWLDSHDPLLSVHIPPPGADDLDRRQQNLDVPLASSSKFLPKLRLLVMSSLENKDRQPEAVHIDRDLGLAVERILHARSQLSVQVEGLWVVAGSGDKEEGEALLRESMDLGHVAFKDGRIDARIYSGLHYDVVV
ncbi:hypothetical protein DL93DRAFT_2157230 [Clavulina sp. PMI_390]|nr:hypothetical protein DL93DRAFT_2157230 [Clavulina sp. PMI_390]